MISFTNLTSKSIPRSIFVRIYKKIFSQKDMELSVVFAPPSLMRKLNRERRGKDKVANVLSFLLDKNLGEIFLNRNEKNLPYLFVHGCLHLKGYDHENEVDM